MTRYDLLVFLHVAAAVVGLWSYRRPPARTTPDLA